MKNRWLIWSNEHRAWWAPNHRGCTVHIQRAGIYTKAEADAICDKKGPSMFPGIPDEVAVIAPLAVEMPDETAEHAADLSRRVQTLRLRPGDKLVANFPGSISHEGATIAKELLERICPGVPVLIVDGGASLQVVRGPKK